MDFKELKERFDEAKSYKLRWIGLYKDLYSYVLPDRDAFNELWGYVDVGKPTTQMVWDDTAVLAAYQRANDLHGLLLPQDRVWGKLALDPHIYGEDLIEQAQPLMDEMNERIFYFLNQSNLSRAVSSSNLDLVGGTGALWVESQSDNVPLYFRSIPAVTLFIEYTTDDVLNNCWYGCKLRGRDILRDYPDYNGSLKNQLIDNPNELYLVNYGQISSPNKPFYIYAVLDSDPFHPLFEREKPYNQIIIYRDRVRPGEAEGRGVGMDLLPTIRDLNHIVEDDRKSLAFKARPPLFYDSDSYFNPYAVRQWAGSMIPRDPTGRNPIEPMVMPTSPDVLQQIQHLQQIILKGFQVDPLGEVDTPVKSATEISVRENRAQRTSATDISRLINELPKQIYEVCAKILNERGLLVKKRQQIPGFSTEKLRFDYVSPLYDLQNQQELNALTVSMQTKQQYFGEGVAMASVDLPETLAFINKKLNLPAKLSTTKEAMKETLAQAMQQAQQAQIPQGQTAASQVPLPQSPGVII